jgi:hypothetical protein
VLNGNFRLHNIEDVEAFCAVIIQRAGLDLSYHDSEDLLAFLIESAWELSIAYDRGDPKFTDTYFPFYAKRMLSRRVVDWQRNRNGRTRWTDSKRWPETNGVYERERPILVTLDDRPDEPDVSQPVDTEVGGLSDLIGLLGKRSSAVPQRDSGMGKAPSREAA